MKTFACDHCVLAFIGEDAVHRWSMHGWAHVELVEHLLDVTRDCPPLTAGIPVVVG